MWWVIFLYSLQDFLLLAFNIFTVMYLTMDLIELFYLEIIELLICIDSCLSSNLVIFFAINIIFSLCFSTFFWYFNYIYVSALKGIPNVSKLCLCFFILFFLFFISCNCWSFLQDHWTFLLSNSNVLLTPSTINSNHTLQLQKFHFVFFHNSCVFHWYCPSDETSSSYLPSIL